MRMTMGDLLADAFGRVRGVVHDTVSGMTPEQLAARPDNRCNSIAWLVWHLTRIQDDHIADLAGTEQAWTSEGWADRFGLPFPPAETGYGHSEEYVAAVRAAAELLTGYHDAVYRHTIAYVQQVTEADLDRVVDKAWDPPVTLGVRLVSVISDDLQHAGQAAYVRGLILPGWIARDV
jgi:uncharacterized damage-inducible protein DinB